MRTIFTSLVLLSIPAVVLGLTGCVTPDAKQSAGTAIPYYETAEQIKAMPPCEAAVVENQPCYSIFSMAEGKQFSIGSPAATRKVVQFLQTLKKGQTYKFPGVFLDYQEKKQQ